MHYGGWYQAVAIPLLKAALREAYVHKKFFGGRGPRDFQQVISGNPLQYLNHFDPDLNQFSRFRGHETVTYYDGFLLGEHHYFGGLML